MKQHETRPQPKPPLTRDKLCRRIQVRTFLGRPSARSRMACLALAAAFATVSAVAVPVTGASALQGPVTAQGTPFTDLDDASDETRQAIYCIFDASITHGTSATTYSPSRPVNRRQMALFLTRLLDVLEVPSPEAAETGFTDLGGVEEEARSAVARLFGLGITRGTSATEFSPTRPVNRRQMALFLTRLLSAAGVEPASGFVPGYDDTANLDAESHTAVAQMQVHDVMRGMSATEFAPTATVTRAPMAWFLSRALAVASTRRGLTPPSGCDDIASSHNAIARPSAVNITLDPQEPRPGGSVSVRAMLTDRRGDPIPGLSVRLVRDGRAPSNYVETGRNGTATFTVDSPPASSRVSSIALEVMVEDLVLTSSATTIRWTIDLTGVTPALAVRVDDSSPTVGDDVDIVATATDASGTPLAGAELAFIIDGETQGTAFAGPDGQATFTYDAPMGPSNEGGYDSLQVQVVSTDAVSRPVGVFWQTPESRRITISVSPDRAHTSAARTITAQVFDGTSPLAGRTVELYIDGAVAARATTDSEGVAKFTRSAPVHGPFDLAKVALADDRDLASDTVLLSWPMGTRGVDSDNSWQLVWSDEFNGAALDTAKWKANNNCPPVYLACDTDRTENVYVSDGLLHLRTLRERYAGTNNWKGRGEQFGPLSTYTPGRFLLKDFTAGRVESTSSFTYGRFELLGRLPQGHGTFFAYWMRPVNSPYGRGVTAGEIDIAEGANIGKGGIDAQLPGPGWGVHHVSHMGLPFTNPYTLTNLPVNPAESFHLYTVEWDTASIRFYVDDQRVLTVPSSDWFSQPAGSEQPVDNPLAPFDVPFVVGINNTVGNWALETWPGNQVPDSTVFPTEFVVDYIRVYECRPPSGSALGPGQGCETP